MLEAWQSLFPEVFEAHPHSKTWMEEEQFILNKVLNKISDMGLLHSDVVDCLLSKPPLALQVLPGLLECLSAYNYLDNIRLHSVLSYRHLDELNESIFQLLEKFHLTPEVFELLLASKQPQDMVYFILHATEHEADLASICHYLTHEVTEDGVSRTTTLFAQGTMSFYSRTFASISTLLANPLCQTIFDARLRGFSDYSITVEPLNKTSADKIINQLTRLNSYEDQVATFFDFFAEYRPFPPSSSYVVEIDMLGMILTPLTAYCEKQIETIETKEDYLKVKQLITQLKTKGGDEEVFYAIKHAIASDIEHADWCSRRSYKQHMEDIWAELERPQVWLSNFTHELENSPGYQQMITTQMSAHSLLRPPSRASVDSEEECDSVLYCTPRSPKEDSVVSLSPT